MADNERSQTGREENLRTATNTPTATPTTTPARRYLPLILHQ